MAIRKILVDGDPALRKKCHPVTNFDEKLADLLDDCLLYTSPSPRDA